VWGTNFTICLNRERGKEAGESGESHNFLGDCVSLSSDETIVFERGKRERERARYYT